MTGFQVKMKTSENLLSSATLNSIGPLQIHAGKPVMSNIFKSHYRNSPSREKQKALKF